MNPQFDSLISKLDGLLGWERRKRREHILFSLFCAAWALAIALFYAIGTGIGGVAGPALFGALIDTGSRNSVFAGYLFGSVLMIVAAVVAWRYAIAAERKSLESVARPLAFVE